MLMEAVSASSTSAASTSNIGIDSASWALALLAFMVTMSAMAVPGVLRRCFAAFNCTLVHLALLTSGLAFLHRFGSAAWSGYAPASVPDAIFWLIDLLIGVVFVNCAPLSPLTPGFVTVCTTLLLTQVQELLALDEKCIDANISILASTSVPT